MVESLRITYSIYGWTIWICRSAGVQARGHAVSLSMGLDVFVRSKPVICTAQCRYKTIDW